MAESRVNTGDADAVQRYLEDREQRHLRGLADTELTVDLIGYGDDSAYGLAERGIQSINSSTRRGDLWEKIRNVGADLGPDAGLSGAGAIYNKDKSKPHVFSSIGSRGVVEVAPGGILTNPSISTGGIRHELAHRGFDALRRSMDLGGYEVPVPVDALSKVLEKGDSSDAEHLLIESLDASTRLKTGEKLSKEAQSVGRLGFDTIAQYMNDPSDENRDQALHRIQQALSRPSRSNFFDRSVYNTAIHMLKEDGVFSRKTPIANQILPYQLLDSLIQASMNFNTKPDTGREVHPFERFDQGGVVGADPYATDIYSLDDLFGLADTEFVVDVIGSGDDMASNLAQRGLRDMQRRSTEGGLSTLIRNLGGDATVEEFQMPESEGIYNSSSDPLPIGEGYSDEPYVGSRGPIIVEPRSILLGQNAEKGTIRHELEHAGIKALNNPLNADIQQAGGKYPYDLLNVPISAMSTMIGQRNIDDITPYTDAADHFLIESMQASERLRSGQGLEPHNVREREPFFVIGEYLNNPTPEKKAVVLNLLENIMSITPEEYRGASYGDQVILNAGYDLMGFYRKRQQAEGVPPEQLVTIDRITPELLLQNLEQSIANYGSPPEKRYSTKVFEKGGEVEGGIVTIPVDREPRPADQRNEAFGAKLLKLAGLATTPRQLAGKVDPMVYRQMDEVLGRKPSFKESDGGIGSMKQY